MQKTCQNSSHSKARRRGSANTTSERTPSTLRRCSLLLTGISMSMCLFMSEWKQCCVVWRYCSYLNRNTWYDDRIVESVDFLRFANILYLQHKFWSSDTLCPATRPCPWPWSSSWPSSCPWRCSATTAGFSGNSSKRREKKYFEIKQFLRLNVSISPWLERGINHASLVTLVSK